MDPARWQRIDALLTAALEQREDTRAAFLSQACQGDEDLRKAVERLLKAYCDAASFLETSPSHASTAMAAAQTSSELEANLPLQPRREVNRGLALARSLAWQSGSARHGDDPVYIFPTYPTNVPSPDRDERPCSL